MGAWVLISASWYNMHNARKAGSSMIIYDGGVHVNHEVNEPEHQVAMRSPDVAKAAVDWVYDMDAANAWDRLGPNGLETRQQMLDLARMAQVVREDMLDSPYADKLHAMVAQANQALIRGETTTTGPAGAFEQPMMPVPAAMLELVWLL